MAREDTSKRRTMVEERREGMEVAAKAMVVEREDTRSHFKNCRMTQEKGPSSIWRISARVFHF